MDAFVRSLVLSNKSEVEDTVHSCFRILHWWTSSPWTDLAYKDIETLLKSGVFLHECLQMFGNALQRTLTEHYPFQTPFIEAIFRELSASDCFSLILSKIGKSDGAMRHCFALEGILKSLESLYPAFRLSEKLTAAYASTFEGAPTHRDQMISMVGRLFRLPSQQIDECLCRLLDRSPFEVVGCVFLEPTSSAHFDKCAIVEDRICSQLISGQISGHFIHSAFILAADSEEGLEFYWRCLKSPMFAKGLMVFLLSCLSHMHISRNTDVSFNDPKFQAFVPSEILFLSYSALSSKSSVRLEFYESIKCSKIHEDVINVMRKLTAIYS